MAGGAGGRRWQFLLVGQGLERIQEVLADLGSCQTAAEEEVEERARAQGFDLVVLSSPGSRDTVELVNELLERQPGLRLVVATASPTWMRARQALKAGAIDYISKVVLNPLQLKRDLLDIILTGNQGEPPEEVRHGA